MPTKTDQSSAHIEIEHIKQELFRATKLFGPFNSTHEGYAVIKEELDEMWDAIKANNIAAAREEARQVAAMAIRFLIDVDDV